MTLRIQIDALGETIVQRDLLRFGQNLKSYRVPLQRSAVIMREAVKKQFATGGQYGNASTVFASGAGGTIGMGAGWPPDQPETVARKRAAGLSLETMEATRRLYLSLSRASHPEHIEQVSADTLRFGTTVPYAVYHQSSRPRHRLPFRPPVALSEADKRRITREIQKHALDGLVGEQG